MEKEDIAIIGERLGRVERYFLQQYVASGPLLDEAYRDIQPYPVTVLQEMGEVAASFAEVSGIRGI